MPDPDISDVRAAFPEWEIGANSAGGWQAELTTAAPGEPRPRLVAGSLAGLIAALNSYVAGRGSLTLVTASLVGVEGHPRYRRSALTPAPLLLARLRAPVGVAPLVAASRVVGLRALSCLLHGRFPERTAWRQRYR